MNKKSNFISNDNDQFKVFRTIVACINQHIRSIDFNTYSALDYLIVRGVDKSGKFSVNNKRSRVYTYLLKKNGYSPKVDTFFPDGYKSGEYIYVKLSDK